MSTEIAVVEKDDDVVMPENVISLKQFPPKVRKVAKYALQCDKIPQWKKACEETGVDYDTFRTLVYRSKKKGHDFHRFIDVQADTYLKMQKLAVHSALVSGAVSDSHADRKLYYQLTGDLKETTSTTNITLAIGINSSPHYDAPTASEKGVLDVEPVVPDDVE